MAEKFPKIFHRQKGFKIIMFKIMSAHEAVHMIPDGACIEINSFLALANPNELHSYLTERFKGTGHPHNFTLFCASGFGGWSEELFADQYVPLGAVLTFAIEIRIIKINQKSEPFAYWHEVRICNNLSNVTYFNTI